MPHRAQKIKDNERASIKYGLDYLSLTGENNGLTPDQALNLQKALYVHTIGFYGTVANSVHHSKNKKVILVSVLRAYQ